MHRSIEKGKYITKIGLNTLLCLTITIWIVLETETMVTLSICMIDMVETVRGAESPRGVFNNFLMD